LRRDIEAAMPELLLDLIGEEGELFELKQGIYIYGPSVFCFGVAGAGR
jgi:hypothetical protein